MTRYVVDPAGSHVSAVLRPAGATRPRATVVDGEVSLGLGAEIDPEIDLGGGHEPRGTLTVQVELDPDGAGTPPVTVTVEVGGARAAVDTGIDGTPVLHGSATLPAGAVGLNGPPLINPSLVLRWRLALREVERNHPLRPAMTRFARRR